MAATVTTARAGLKTLLIDSREHWAGHKRLCDRVAGMVEGFCKEFLDRLKPRVFYRARIFRPRSREANLCWMVLRRVQLSVLDLPLML